MTTCIALVLKVSSKQINPSRDKNIRKLLLDKLVSKLINQVPKATQITTFKNKIYYNSIDCC